MAKLTRSDLKNVVKECLIEILAEGISGTGHIKNKSLVTESRAAVRQPQPARVKNKKVAADRLKVESNNDQLIESLAGDDSLMKDIFRDTLNNTITARPSVKEDSSYAQRTVHGDGATKEMLHSDPMNLFEGSTNWAALAFSSKDKP